jgi:hypothetical protein
MIETTAEIVYGPIIPNRAVRGKSRAENVPNDAFNLRVCGKGDEISQFPHDGTRRGDSAREIAPNSTGSISLRAMRGGRAGHAEGSHCRFSISEDIIVSAN